MQSSAVIIGLIYHDIAYDIAITVAESESDIRITTDTPYLALMGKLWTVYCEGVGDNWPHCSRISHLSHWGRMTHLCVGKLTTIGSDNVLSPRRRQAIIWTNAGILLIRTLGTKFSEILSEIRTFSFKKLHLKVSSAKWRPFCLGLNVLTLQRQR